MPEIRVIAGPNGVGKTTFADQFLPNSIQELEFVNADLIARGLSPYDPDAASMEAGRVALSRIRHLIAQKRSFTWETTMSGKTAVTWLRSAKEAGYKLKCYFLWVRDVETTLSRIHTRVVEGGHNINADLARRRFFKTIQNFFNDYSQLFDSWKLIENEDESSRLLAVRKHERLIIRDRKAFERIIAEAGIRL